MKKRVVKIELTLYYSKSTDVKYNHLFLEMTAFTATRWLRYLNLITAVEDINKAEYLAKYLSNNIFVKYFGGCTTRLPCRDKQCIQLSFPFTRRRNSSG